MNLKIKLEQEYKSFSPQFEAEILGPLALISGVNGSGKTQLIDIIKGYRLNDINSQIQRRVTQDGIELNDSDIASKSFRDYHGLNELTPAAVNNTASVRDQIFNWYSQIRFQYNQHNQVVPPQYREAAKQAKNLLIEKFGLEAFNSGQLTREDVKSAIPGDFVLFEDDIFSNKVGELFFNHVSLVYKKEAEAGRSGLKFDPNTLLAAPWKILNDLFDKLKFGYRFKDNYLRVDDEIDVQPAIYAVNDDGSTNLEQKRALYELSDGEKALISLTFAVIANDHRKTKILLLDEYDATLNPSLIESFFVIIQDFFVNKGIQVIMVTHSSATLSLAPANANFYEIYKPNNQNVRFLPVNQDQYSELAIANKNFYKKIADQQERLNNLMIEKDELSKLVQILRNGNDTKVQIITEGNNISHLEKAIKVLQPSLLDKIEFVRGAEHVTGKNQMKPAFEIMTSLLSNHKIVFVWDVDAESSVKQLRETSTCRKFSFALNPLNKKIVTGIENLYPEEFISDDLYSTKETARFDGGKNIQIELDKKKFLAKVEQNTDQHTFQKFSAIISFLIELSKAI